MKSVKKLAIDFRRAIECAHNAGEFQNDFIFRKFPIGCCGDCCYLLGEFLIENGIETNYVCGNYRDGNYENRQSHAWLETIDCNIIDITGDQFKHNSVFLNYNEAVYVGKYDEFHKLFEVHTRDVHKSCGLDARHILCFKRLKNIYDKIIKYI